MVEECRGKEYEERLKIMGLVSLETRRVRADLLEVYKILSGLEGIDETKLFRRHISATRGHSMKLYKERVNRDVLKFSFANRVIEMWNKLPEEIISAKGLNIFKNRLDKYLRKNEGFHEF